MPVNELRTGNLIKVCPRENQEGLLRVKEIQHSSVICEMISPRRGYQFRIRPSEMLPVQLTEEWLTRAGFVPDQEIRNRWRDSRNFADFLFTQTEGRFGIAGSPPVNYVHELQNEYLKITGADLVIADHL